MLAPPCITNALLIPEKINMKQVSATLDVGIYVTLSLSNTWKKHLSHGYIFIDVYDQTWSGGCDHLCTNQEENCQT